MVAKLQARFATPKEGYYDLIVVLFVAFLLLSNISATKIIGLPIGPWHLVFDGGAVLFPVTYVLGDVLSEIYGLKATRKAIVLGFIVSLVAVLVFKLVQIAPPGPGYDNQAAFTAVLGFVPRIVFASLLGYLAGQLLNSIVLVKMKERFGESNLWARLIGSTLVGELVDTAVFCSVAFIGIIPGWEFVNYLVVGYLYKVGLEIILLPITYPVIGLIKRHEPSYSG